MRLLLGLALLLAPPAAAAQDAPGTWAAILGEARGQTVDWHAWGGSTATNDFIAWLGERVAERHGVTLRHVKLSDTAEAVSRILSERAAGVPEGAVDLVWINGPNFARLRDAALLFGPFAADLPNARFLDPADPGLTHDFTVPTEGYESPWAKAQVVYMADSARVPSPPRTAGALADWIVANPGRFTYPRPPDFLGVTFLKQMLIELAPATADLARPAEDAVFERMTAPLWTWLDAVTPHLWRQGRAYPASGPAQLALISDGEIDIAISFSPGEASTAIADGRLPDTVRTFVPDGGTLGNVSFVAIPVNAGDAEGAMVVANELLEPDVQLRAQDPAVLGYGTVLDMARLPEATASAFAALDQGVATLSPEELGPVRPEPHPSWSSRLAEAWQARYGTE